MDKHFFETLPTSWVARITGWLEKSREELTETERDAVMLLYHQLHSRMRCTVVVILTDDTPSSLLLVSHDGSPDCKVEYPVGAGSFLALQSLTSHGSVPVDAHTVKLSFFFVLREGLPLRTEHAHTASVAAASAAPPLSAEERSRLARSHETAQALASLGLPALY